MEIHDFALSSKIRLPLALYPLVGFEHMHSRQRCNECSLAAVRYFHDCILLPFRNRLVKNCCSNVVVHCHARDGNQMVAMNTIEERIPLVMATHNKNSLHFIAQTRR